MAHSASPLLRLEDARLLRGQGRFVANERPNGLAHAVFVRSPHAHARILSLNTDDAQAQPGVMAVLGPADFASLRQPKVNALLSGMVLPEGPLVPGDEVLAVGAPLALVVAQTAEQAQAAAEQVWIVYEDLPVVADFERSATRVHANVPDNLALQAEVQVGQLPLHAPSGKSALTLPRVAASPLEPRAALMHWDTDMGLFQAWLSTQTPSRAREELALALNLAPDQVRVIATDVGGAFGGKASIFPEDLMLALAAKRLGRPLLWQASRGEDLLSGTHGRASRLQGQLWLDGQQNMQALSADLEFALGHWLPFSAAAPLRNTSRILPGPYRIGAWQLRGQGRLSHAAAVGIYRGAGRPEACILMERLVDEAAHAHGIDPLTLRLNNVWGADELPRTLGSGVWLDRANLPALLQRAATLFDYPQRRAEQAAARQGESSALIGLGMALYMEPCGQGGESMRLSALADGRFVLATGATAQGQGRETAYTVLLAQALGCEPGLIEVRHGDTATCPPGIGALASRSTAIGGSALLQVAEELKQQLAAGIALPCTVERFLSTEQEAWASGCVMLALHIDRDTGQPRVKHLVWVDDAGVMVSPTMVHGQLIGGLAQGLGQALMEKLVYDSTGQLLTGSLMDYALPRAEDMPEVQLESLPTPSAANLLGAKGVGEAGCIGLPAALLNAAHDALAPLRPAGAAAFDLDFPLSAATLWRAMRPQDGHH
jgi:carbon-monoxide dehydrogenase large subunit